MPSLETHMPCTCRARAELGLTAGSWWWKCSKGTICTSAMSSKTEPFRFEGAPWLEKSRVKLALAKPRPDERWGKWWDALTSGTLQTWGNWWETNASLVFPPQKVCTFTGSIFTKAILIKFHLHLDLSRNRGTGFPNPPNPKLLAHVPGRTTITK